MSYLKEKLTSKLHDPQKLALVNSLTPEMLAAVAGEYTEENWELIQTHPDADALTAIRVITLNQVLDYNTSEADRLQTEISEFIDSPSFVQYPDFLIDETILAAVKTEQINNHAQSLKSFLAGTFSTTADMEILGARITYSNTVEVMILHNPSKQFGSDTHFFQADTLQVPKIVKIGLLKKNSPVPFYGKGNELYVSMESPYPGKYGQSQFTEIIIGHFDEAGAIDPIENV